MPPRSRAKLASRL